MLLMIDNYDSFAYNLVQYFGELGQQLTVMRNDQAELMELCNLQPEFVVISPGPCRPEQAGISTDLVGALGSSVPILGVCLGHQCIAQAYGGIIVHAHTVMHGKTSMIHHKGVGVFKGLPSPFEATRYHSLVVDVESLPPDLEVTAWTETATGEFDEIMGLRHRRYPVEGVQFHPESILSEHGHALLANFLDASKLAA